MDFRIRQMEREFASEMRAYLAFSTDAISSLPTSNHAIRATLLTIYHCVLEREDCFIGSTYCEEADVGVREGQANGGREDSGGVALPSIAAGHASENQRVVEGDVEDGMESVSPSLSNRLTIICERQLSLSDSSLCQEVFIAGYIPVSHGEGHMHDEGQHKCPYGERERGASSHTEQRNDSRWGRCSTRRTPIDASREFVSICTGAGFPTAAQTVRTSVKAASKNMAKGQDWYQAQGDAAWFLSVCRCRCVVRSPSRPGRDYRVVLARFHNVIAKYYLDRVRIPSEARAFLQRALSLAFRCNSDVAQVRALSGLASMACCGGRYSESRCLGSEVHTISLPTEDINGRELGFESKQSGRRMGVEGGEFENMMLNTEADVYQLQSEYLEAWRLHELILSQTSVAQSPVTHARTLDIATTTFRHAQHLRGVNACNVYRADFMLREGEASRARAEYVRLWDSLRGEDDELAGCCLAKLADPARSVHGDAESARWAAVFLAFTLHAPTRNQLVLHQALRCFADVLGRQGEYDVSLSVFEIALEGFTMMDVY
ncbi:hypothetical protein R3P38DRAFT_3222231 [Favolaschia claudopus]|uniref:Uncharacterized protein n=1 Tax=Favolaschia claudopus TaxID=2862362 RepID=A0AAV9ZZ47_9AGAR